MASLTGREEGASSVIDFMKPPQVVSLICSPKVLHKPLSGK